MKKKPREFLVVLLKHEGGYRSIEKVVYWFQVLAARYENKKQFEIIRVREVLPKKGKR